MASMEGETLEYLSLAAAHLPGNWSMAWPIQYYQDAEKTYHWLMSLGDPRVESWPLMATPWPTLTIALVYTLVCAVIPKQFKGVWRESLTPVLLIYNIFLVLLNVFIVMELYPATKEYNWVCEPVDYTDTPANRRVASALWFYYISKLIEMLDSIFFILRGKLNQLTFLHVYHHASMFCLWWIGVKYVAGGSSIFGAFFNSVVHVVMYFYYFMAALGPGYRKYLGWKRYLTVLQMVQFISAIGMGLNAIRVKCNFPLWMQYAMIVYMISFLVLFSDFYRRTYNRRQKRD